MVRKWRLPKSYRLPLLDERIRQRGLSGRRGSPLMPGGMAFSHTIICDVSRFELKMEHIGEISSRM